MRIGVVILPEHRWAEGASLWRRAEELGFHHAWTYDHLAWRSLRDSAWFGAVPTLAAAAGATSSIRLGTLVASPNFRHPVAFSRELLALDDISGGRFALGVGAGGRGFDSSVLGQPPLSGPERAERFEEFVTLTDLLLRNPETNFEGRYYSAHEARSHPGCLQSPRIPFVVAATGAIGMALAARFGQGWVTTGRPEAEVALPPAEGSKVVREQIRRLEEACSAIGRDPSSIDRMVLTGVGLDPGLSSPAQFVDVCSAYEQIGVTDLVVHWPRPTPPFATGLDVFEEIFAG